MNYLLINTANEELVITIYKNGEIYSCLEAGSKRHNEVFLPKLDELLIKANLTLNDIDEFGVVVGPGSFTGIRVGIASVKAFKDVFDKPVRAINNLQLLYDISKANNLNSSAVAIEGSMNSYFVGKVSGDTLQIYERNLTLDELKEVSNNELVAMYNNNYNYEKAKCVKFDEQAFVQSFLNSSNYDLTPIYYQLSQAQNDKIDNSNLILREAEMWDIKAICDMDKVNFSNNWDEAMLEKMFVNRNTKIYVAEIDKVVIGFIVLENEIDEINISRVVVDSEYRNHGLGSKLIKCAFKWAKELKIDNVSLEVSSNNFTAKTLYEKLGFSLRRVRKAYYKDGSDAIEMVKPV